MKKCLHILLLASVLLLSGCVDTLGPTLGDGNEMVLTVRCGEASVTKATELRDGEKRYNENLIKSVDFFFYHGADPAGTDAAVYHIRRELTEDPMPVNGPWEVSFNLVLKKDAISRIFTTGNSNPADDNKALVYTLVNAEKAFIDTLSQTSRDYLAAMRFTSDFARTETDFKQPFFLMDGSEVLTYNDAAEPSVDGRIDVTRLASKVTVSVQVENLVILKHQDPAKDPDEYWRPVLHTMRIYLVDGVKTVLLGGKDPDAEFFSYKDAKRPFVLNDGTGTPIVTPPTVDGYYDTYPMYTFPYEWETNVRPDPLDHIDHIDGTYHEPYLKLEMDWTRGTENGYSFDQRKYYYKVFLPFDEFKRNNWYCLLLDVGILGSETDEGKALLQPSCYILDWQNKTEIINKNAVISKARYLSVEKETWELNNMNETEIPFLSSHIVTIANKSNFAIQATRPYYGQITTAEGHRVGDYNPIFHAWIRKKEGKEEYYLDYVQREGDPARPEQDKAKYDPVNWLTNTSTSVVLKHDLQNNYSRQDFDYSPYTIDFYIVHNDLDTTTLTYDQYLRHIRIIQYPAIYIVATRNSDWEIMEIDGNGKKIPAGYPTGTQPWPDKPWGYVYVNGGRILRQYSDSYRGDPHDPYYDLQNNNSKKEYQWQAVWYTGGSRDMFKINVTVLPNTSTFVIGDPRKKEIDNLAPTEEDPNRYASMYRFTPANENDKAILRENFKTTSDVYPDHYDADGVREGFAYAPVAPSIQTGIERERKLTYYHPTDKSSRTENMLAPSFMISSKFGGTEFGTITREMAEYRCAAYQEDGFPAGRWRLPTKSEIHFVVQLAANNTFERLFESNSYYWSAHGAVKPNGTSVDVVSDPAGGARLRCVYDTWYWGDTQETPRAKFFWGDKE